MDNWKNIWENRTDNFDSIDMQDKKSLFLELKRIDGFDVLGGGVPYSSLIEQYNSIIYRLSQKRKIKSIFEVGCGCGANLFLLDNDDYEFGGIDYSSALIKIAKRIFVSYKELICDEAINLPTDIKYDAIFSNSVFSYFPDEQYAANVLDKILKKANISIGLIDIHNIEKKDAFKEYRRKTVENYDVKYKNLNKLFYSKDFFYEWGKKNNCKVEFYDSDVQGYWNNQFVFDVYFSKEC